MELSFKEFIFQLSGSRVLFIITALILGVIFVNGCTDSPNSIATCIATRSIRPKKAILMAAMVVATIRSGPTSGGSMNILT